MTAVELSVQDTVSPIYFRDLDRVKTLTNNTTQAEFLCRIVYFFRITNIIENGIKWFTRSSEDLAEICRVSTRTIRRYLNQFEQQGYIEKKRRMFSRQHLYITVTDKLLTLLRNNKPSKTSKTAPILQTDKMATCSNIVYGINTTKNKATSTELELRKKENKKESNKIYSSNTKLTKPDAQSNCAAKKNGDLNLSDRKPTLSDYEEYERLTNKNDSKLNNEVNSKPQFQKTTPNTKETFSSNTKNSQKTHKNSHVSNFIGKALTQLQEKYIASTVRNLGRKTEITKPEQLITEMKEAAINPKRFSKAKNFKHKVNTMAKCIRVGRWRDAVNFDEEQVQNDDTFNPKYVSVDADTGALTIEAEQSKPKSKYAEGAFSDEDEEFWQAFEARGRARRIERNKL